MDGDKLVEKATTLIKVLSNLMVRNNTVLVLINFLAFNEA